MTGKCSCCELLSLRMKTKQEIVHCTLVSNACEWNISKVKNPSIFRAWEITLSPLSMAMGLPFRSSWAFNSNFYWGKILGAKTQPSTVSGSASTCHPLYIYQCLTPMGGVRACMGYWQENVACVRGSLIFFDQGIPESRDYWHPWLRWTGPVIKLSSCTPKMAEEVESRDLKKVKEGKNLQNIYAETRHPLMWSLDNVMQCMTMCFSDPLCF